MLWTWQPPRWKNAVHSARLYATRRVRDDNDTFVRSRGADAATADDLMTLFFQGTGYGTRDTVRVRVFSFG